MSTSTELGNALVCAALALVFVLVFMRSEPGASKPKEASSTSGRGTEGARK